MIYVCGPRDRPRTPDVFIINTTSRSDNWSRGLSPFFCGPCNLYDGYVSKNVENGWQNSKVHKEHVGTDGNPTKEYFEWAKNGWNDHIAHRYPMGKGRKPEYSWWDGKKLDYIEARKKIYVPLYSNAVRKTSAFYQLEQLAATLNEVWLWDFDGYNHREKGMTFDDVLNDEGMKMGHAFVLFALLEGIIK